MLIPLEPFVLLLPLVGAPQGASAAAGRVHSQRPEFTLVENVGQLDPTIEFCALRGGARVAIDRSGFAVSAHQKGSEAGSFGQIDTVRFEFEGASPEAQFELGKELRGREHTFRGPKPGGWMTEASRFSQVVLRGVIPGVDVTFRDHGGRFEYDLLVTNPLALQQCVMRCEGARSLWIDEEGSLHIETGSGELCQTLPVAWVNSKEEGQVSVPCRFELVDGMRFRLVAPQWDSVQPLWVDPGLVYSSYLGGSSGDGGYAVGCDGQEGAYITGGTGSLLSFPTTPGAFDVASVNPDAFVAKFDTNATSPSASLVYSTFLGGAGPGNGFVGEIGYGIEVDVLGQAVMAGSGHMSYPTTAGSFMPVVSKETGVLTKLNASGNALVYSTFTGGLCVIYDLALSPEGRVYATGFAGITPPFPATPGAFQTNHTAGDAFVMKFNASGSALQYATLCGGDFTASSTSGEDAYGIAIDSTGAAYVCGSTGSELFPTTPGAFQTTFGFGIRDAFVFKLNPQGSQLVYSTYLGSPPGPLSEEIANAIAVDDSGCAIVTGSTLAGFFPTTPGAFDTTPNWADVFIVRLAPDGKSLIYSTVLGGNGVEISASEFHDLVLDKSGAAYITAATTSLDFPTTPDAFDPTPNGGGRDGFMSVLSPSGDSLLYSTIFGAQNDGVEELTGIALAPDGSVYLSGRTSGSDWPTTSNAFDSTFNNTPGIETDAAVVRLSLPNPAVSLGLKKFGIGTRGCAGYHTLWAASVPTVGNATFALTSSVAPPNALGLVILGSDALLQGADPLGLGIAMHVDPFGTAIDALDLHSDAAGKGLGSLAIPANAALSGLTVVAQAFWLWPSASCTPSTFGLSSSNGLWITVQ